MAAQAAGSDSAAVAKQVCTRTRRHGTRRGGPEAGACANCLVGLSGKGFDSQEENPCKGQGQGAIVDAKGDTASESRLHTALTQAEHGLKTTTLDGAHADAQQIMTSLQAN